eukprot:369846_1
MHKSEKTLIDHSAEVSGQLNRLRITSPETCDALFVLGYSRATTTTPLCGRCTECKHAPQELRCHRAVMASVSKYFLSLLYGEYLESKQNRIELLDVPHDTFEAIIQYAYTGSIYVGPDNVMDILSIAYRFDISQLVEACSSILDQCLSPENVCNILVAAEHYGQAELEKRCWSVIHERGWEVVWTPGFQNLTPTLLEQFVEYDELQ